MAKLLLIDDEEGIRKVLKISLTSDGHEVMTAANGQKGLDLFQEGQFSIVMTDLKMPGVDGIQVLERIKELNPDVEVIVFTGHGDMGIAIQSLRLGASDFITKPVSDEALTVALKRAEQRLEMKQKLKAYTTNLEKMVKDATKEIERRYEFEDKLVQRSIDGIVATDKEGNIVVFNPAAEKIFGYTGEETKTRKKADDIYPKGMRKKIADCLSGAKKTVDDIFVGEDTSVVGKDGKVVPVRFSGAILYEAETPIGCVGYFQDLREIKRLQAELIKSEKLAAVGQTVAGLAHCIKNILNGLIGGLYMVNNVLKKWAAGLTGGTDELLLIEQRTKAQIEEIRNEKKPPFSQLMTGWDMVERNINKVSDLVLDLLSYSKDREPRYEKCDPNNIASEVCELMEAKANEQNIVLIKDFDRGIGEVYLDPVGIHRCILNLVSNAIDACVYDPDKEKGWYVKVTTRPDKDGGVIFATTDNGCGMDEEVKEKLFTEFFSTKGARGTGLGMLVTEKVVKEHSGAIDVESQLGKGTIFTIRLPGKEFLKGE
ncbi:MAG: response regulator [Pseudomonadota bacterium]